jgi:hypothetical protein
MQECGLHTLIDTFSLENPPQHLGFKAIHLSKNEWGICHAFFSGQQTPLPKEPA